MDLAKLKGVGAALTEWGQQASQGVQQHPLFFAAGLGFLLLTWSHFKGDYGPETWSLSQERHKALRGLVHLLVMPLRLIASLLSSLVALLVIALLAGFGYVLWRMLQG